MTAVARLARAALLCLVLPGIALAQDSKPRIVALVVSTGSEPDRADTVAQGLGRINAETLRVTDPSNASLRAVMRRFAKEAEQSEVAIVYIDMPTVTFEERVFVLPQEAELSRATDLFTQAVPLGAFARMTALSERGGAVIVTARDTGTQLPAEIGAATKAPAAESGMSEILLVPAGQSAPAVAAFSELMANPVRVDLRAVLETMAGTELATLSALPPAPIVLKAPIQVGAPPVQVVQLPAPVANLAQTPEAEPPSIDELTIIEQSLSPAVKRRLQRALRGMGHYDGLIDGIVGDQTRAAINAFQAERSEDETGFLTPGQLRELLAQA